jgi:hypothetical protein
MKTILRFLVLFTIKILVLIFYKFECEWVNGSKPASFKDVRCFFLLNHTSLFEPVFITALSNSMIWEFAKRGVLPGADVTLNRPIAGRFFKMLSPEVVAITRKRDESWKIFIESISRDSIVIMAAEGRMKRPGGLDKTGKKMSVRGGAADVIQKLDTGQLVLVYSGGLHHIQTPGQRFPRLFKEIQVKLEVIEISDYKKFFDSTDDARAVRVAISKDLDKRRDIYCPPMEAGLKFKLCEQT